MVPLDGLGVNWLTTSDLFSYENNIYRTLLNSKSRLYEGRVI